MVANVDVHDTSVCMLVTGRESTISSNQASHCAYGIVVTGNQNTISDNQFNDNGADGILVTGDANVITGNEALRNRGVGLHVVRMVPMIADDSFLSVIQISRPATSCRGIPPRTTTWIWWNSATAPSGYRTTGLTITSEPSDPTASSSPPPQARAARLGTT
jgi:parallel beta-helix repeat protein